jgi:hypothetical protein
MIGYFGQIQTKYHALPFSQPVYFEIQNSEIELGQVITVA